jgi:uncharacterized glyoxalase superfamily protein PhnB
MAEQRVIPMLAYEDAGRAADWITEAFGFSETERWRDDDGTVSHVNLELGGGVFMLGHPSPDYQGPRRHAENCESARKWRQTPYIVDGVLVYVDDIDAHLARARKAGARILTEIETNEFQRQYRAEDVEGHRWMFAQPIGGER